MQIEVNHFNLQLNIYYVNDRAELIRLTYLSYARLLVAFFSAFWGQPGVTMVTGSNTVT